MLLYIGLFMKKKKVVNTECYDASSIYWYATNFENSSIILDLELSRSLDVKKMPAMFPCLVPTVVLRSFSIELYLKCLKSIECGKVPRGHELLSLYLCLSEVNRKKIRDKFDFYIQYNPAVIAMQKQLGEKMVSLSIEDVLRTVNKVFETWRYAYEGKGGSSYGLGELSRAVRETIVELRPEFAKHGVGIQPKPLDIIIMDKNGKFQGKFHGADLPWEKFLIKLFKFLVEEPGLVKGIANFNHNEYSILDVDKESWIAPPERASMLFGRRIALVHEELFKSLQIPSSIHHEGFIRKLLNIEI